MDTADESLQSLREAVRLSADNVPLRQLLADTLLRLDRADEAEKEYREALARDPDSGRLKTGLAQAFFRQGKNSQALVIVEDLLKRADTPARVYLLHARLLLRLGEVERAVRQYRAGIDADPTVADADLAEQLGIGAESDSEVVEGRVRVRGHDDEGGPVDKLIERPKITFQDVGGMETVKEEVRMKIMHPLTHPDLYKAYGKTIGGGVLLYGPPGCGKTHLARATAGEVRARFLAVGLHDILGLWMGESERNLHELFDQARTHRPCVLFFDEVDALGASRSDMRHSSGYRHVINQFLDELDGINADNEGVLILAATNAPWHLDTAFRRPGRFDRLLFVPPPDAAARESILRILCKGKPVDSIDYGHLAKKTEHYSGADLKAVVDVAIEAKLREALKAGVPKPITGKDLLAAAANVKPSTREWFATARNYALYANQGGLYDEILKYLKIS